MSLKSLPEEYVKTHQQNSSLEMSDQKSSRVQYVWRNIVLMTMLYISAIYGLYLLVVRAKLSTLFFIYAIGFMSSMGVQVFLLKIQNQLIDCKDRFVHNSTLCVLIEHLFVYSRP